MGGVGEKSGIHASLPLAVFGSARCLAAPDTIKDLCPVHDDLTRRVDRELDLPPANIHDGDANVLTDRDALPQLPCQY